MKLPVPLLVVVAALVFRANCREQRVGPDKQAASPQDSLGGLLNPDFSGEEQDLSNWLDGLDYFEDTPLTFGGDQLLKKDVIEQNQMELRGNSGKGSIKKLIKNLESMERRLIQANRELKMKLQALQINVTGSNSEFEREFYALKVNLTREHSNVDVKLDSISTSLMSIEAVITNHTAILHSIKEACSAPWVSLVGVGCLLFVQTKARWDPARARCAAEGSDLAILDTPSKRQTAYNYIASTTRDADHYGWLGATDRSGQWRWINGQLITEGWYSGEPNADSGDNTCLEFWKGGLADFACSGNQPFICQK